MTVSARVTPRIALPLTIAAVSAVSLAAQSAPPQRQTPTFRSGVTMVPIDVRVLDVRGQPVTDLTRDDFRVFEDDVPQAIQEFTRSELVAAPAAAALPLTAITASQPVAKVLAPQNRRVFLFVVGRGRQTGPVKVFDALKTFVRDRLLPQDQVAVMGYNRATDFTTDHASLVELLDRYERLHTRIEALIAQNQNLVMGVLGPRDMPVFIQNPIDEVFGAGLYGGRTLPDPGAAARRDEARAAANVGRGLENRVAEMAPQAIPRAALPAVLPGFGTALDDGLLGQYFEDYLGHAVSALTDLGNVHKGLDYLRHVDGEKHLLLVSVSGDLGLWDTTDEDRLASLAADARVALDLIHTGGVVAAPVAGPQGPIQAVPTPGQVFNQTFKVKGMRAMAELSGGQAWAFQTGEHALRQLDQATRFQYVLGYLPTNVERDGQYRKIRVDVARPGVRLIYRRGYYAGEPGGDLRPD